MILETQLECLPHVNFGPQKSSEKSASIRPGHRSIGLDAALLWGDFAAPGGAVRLSYASTTSTRLQKICGLEVKVNLYAKSASQGGERPIEFCKQTL